MRPTSPKVLPKSPEANSLKRKQSQIQSIKHENAQARKLLAQLAKYAYEQEKNLDPNKTSHLLGLNVDDAKFYHRFQFKFDPKLGFDYYKSIFEKLFGAITIPSNYHVNIFQTLFPFDAPQNLNKILTPQEAFNILEAQHPDGVEIWVNNHNYLNAHPLIENHARLTVDSIYSAAKMMLAKMKQEYVAKSPKKEEKQIAAADAAMEKYDLVAATLKIEYIQTIKKINQLYLFESEKSSSPASPTPKKSVDKQKMVQANQYIQYFHKLVVAQMAAIQEGSIQDEANSALSIPLVSSTPKQDSLLQMISTSPRSKASTSDKTEHKSNEPYIKIYLELEKYEQMPKHSSYFPNYLFDEIDQQFNRDIFVLNILKLPETRARFHYHRRHLTRTQQQILHGSAASLTKETKTESASQQTSPALDFDPFVLETSATSHGREVSLHNYAWVEEGFFDITANETSISMVASRYGSPTPAVLYKGDKATDRHETTYRAFLNMEQQLQALRAQIIKNILPIIRSSELPDGYAPETFREYLAQKLAYHITAEIHEKNINKKLATYDPSHDLVEYYNNAIISIAHSENKLETYNDSIMANALEKAAFNNDRLVRLLKAHAHEIINVRNFHTHLITPSGLASEREEQRHQFKDARLAADATHDMGSGYIYMCNPINAGRYDTISKSTGSIARHFTKASSTPEESNAAALITLAEQIHKIYPSFFEKLFNPDNENYKNYLLALKQKHAAAKLYMQFYEKSNPSDTDRLSTLAILRDINKEYEKILHKITFDLNTQIFKIITSTERLLEIIYAKRDSREKYLILGGYLVIQKLFCETTNTGLKKWKCREFNGIMQAFIHLIVNVMHDMQTSSFGALFSSFGCKSNNDRAFFLAMIVATCSLYIETPTRPLPTELIPETCKALLEEAQQLFAWHSSIRQTALDRSGGPKLEQFVMTDAQNILNEEQGDCRYKDHIRLNDFAADKRATKRRPPINPEEMQTLGKLRVDPEECNIYLFALNPENNVPADIQEQLMQVLQQKSIFVKISSYDLIELRCKIPQHNGLLDQICKRKFVLHAQSQATSLTPSGLVKTNGCQQILTLLKELQAYISKYPDTTPICIKNVISHWEGLKQLTAVNLANIFIELKNAVLSEEVPQKLNKSAFTYATSHEAIPVSSLLTILREELSCIKIGEPDFSFDSLIAKLNTLSQPEKSICELNS